MCPDRGTLQAYLDGELDSQAVWEVENHLASCSACKAVLAELRRNLAVTGEVLSGYHKETARLEFKTGRAWEDFSRRGVARPASSSRGGIFGMIKRRNLIAAATVIALVGVLSYGPARTMAASILTIFRADRVQVVTLNPNDFKAFEQALKQAGVADVKDFGKIEVVGKAEEKTVSANEATAAAGFATKIPAGLSGGLELKKVSVRGATAVSITPDVKNLNRILAAIGGTPALPEQLTGKTFTIKTPAVVNTAYQNASGSVSLAQALSPEIVAPEGVDVEALRKTLLSIPSLPAQFRQQLSLRDWQRTMLIPNINGSTQEVSVNGQSGAYISAPDGKRSVLVWQQNSVWYAIEGNLTLQQAQSLATSLK